MQQSHGPKKRSRGCLIAGAIVVGVGILCCGGGIVAMFLLPDASSEASPREVTLAELRRNYAPDSNALDHMDGEWIATYAFVAGSGVGTDGNPFVTLIEQAPADRPLGIQVPIIQCHADGQVQPPADGSHVRVRAHVVGLVEPRDPLMGAFRPMRGLNLDHCRWEDVSGAGTLAPAPQPTMGPKGS